MEAVESNANLTEIEKKIPEKEEETTESDNPKETNMVVAENQPTTEEEPMECEQTAAAETNETIEKNTENPASVAEEAQPEKEDEQPMATSETISSDDGSNNNSAESTTVANLIEKVDTPPNAVNGESKNKKDFSHANGNEESVGSVDEQSQDPQNCYCGRGRNLNVVELQCGGCFKWFHEACLSIPIGKCVPFMTYYSFFCKLCNSTGVETFSKKQPNFSQICNTVLANLMQQSVAEGNPRTMFSKDKEVIPFISDKWEHLTSMQRKIKQTWHNTVHKAVLKGTDIFTCEDKGLDDGPKFGLVIQDLSKIAPSYETTLRGPQKFNIDAQGGAFGKGRSSKRKFFDGQMSGPGKKVKSDLVMPKLPPNGYPSEHPFNKDGYRYILAEPDPHAPFRQEFDESQDWAGKPIPPWLYRKLTPSNVLIALHDRAPQLKVSEDRLFITGEKGYCMARATHGVNRGSWYFECTIEEMPDGAATRIGWSQALGNLQGPLGYDKFSYSWRSRKGTKFHESKGNHFSDGGYAQGDTLGFLIVIPEVDDYIPLPQIFKDKPLVKFKSYLYYEEKDEVQIELKNLSPVPHSKIMFYKNGQSMGTAFEEIYAGTYYPAVSVYKNVTVSLNFGPKFKHKPAEKHKPICDLAYEAIIEQTMTDLLFFTENKGKLRLDNL